MGPESKADCASEGQQHFTQTQPFNDTMYVQSHIEIFELEFITLASVTDQGNFLREFRETIWTWRYIVSDHNPFISSRRMHQKSNSEATKTKNLEECRIHITTRI
jgi:hypothetical protein